MTDAPIPGMEIYDPEDPFEMRAGPFWFDRTDSGLRFALTAEARHCNTHGILHGGLMVTMIDLTLVAVAKETPEEKFVTVSLNSEFIAAARHGDLIEASGELVRRTRSMSFVRGQVTSGGTVLLTASAVLKRIAPR